MWNQTEEQTNELKIKKISNDEANENVTVNSKLFRVRTSEIDLYSIILVFSNALELLLLYSYSLVTYKNLHNCLFDMVFYSTICHLCNTISRIIACFKRFFLLFFVNGLFIKTFSIYKLLLLYFFKCFF